MNHTKIMATIGPASWDEKTLEAMILAGVSSCRINFSHSSYEQAEKIIHDIRRISKKLNRPVAIRQDLQGPKIRIGELEREEGYPLPVGHEITFTREKITGDAHRATIAQPEFIGSIEAGAEVAIGDNDIKLTVLEKPNPDEIRCRVTIPGTLRPRKGAAAPGTIIRFKGLTEKDLRDFEFGIEQKFDCVSMSFVQTADDIALLRTMMKERGVWMPILSKIEQRNALDNLDAIIQASDGLSAARGDLAVERPIEELPLLVKEMIRRCNLAGKFVFTGSGILKSLMHNSWPTRAEVSDVAALVLDGIDAISFSDETAVGDDPVGSVKMLANIIARCEEAMLRIRREDTLFRSIRPHFHTVRGSEAIFLVADRVEPVARMAKMHYTAPVIVPTRNDRLSNYLAHYWGIYPMYCPHEMSDEALLDYAAEQAVSLGMIGRDSGIIRY